jgi:hypothetical protein
MRDLALALLAGMLSGTLVRRRLPPDERRPIARLMSAVLEPVYFWADLKGQDGRPSLSKVSYFLGLLVALWVLLLFAAHERAHDPVGVTDVPWGFIAYALVALAYALGKNAFNTVLTFIAARFPGAPRRLSGAQPAPADQGS